MRTLVLIDDSEGDIELVRLAISEAGLDVDLHVAFDGDRGADLIRHLNPDLVLLDWNMPRVSGEDLLTRLQSENIVPLLKVVMLSTAVSPRNHSLALSLGARASMSKPADFDTLVQLIARTVHYWSLAD